MNWFMKHPAVITLLCTTLGNLALVYAKMVPPAWEPALMGAQAILVGIAQALAGPSASQVAAAPPPASDKPESGFARLPILLVLTALSFWLVGCAATPAGKVAEAAYSAEQAADAALKLVPGLLRAGTITPATAQQIVAKASLVYQNAQAAEACVAQGLSSCSADAALAALADLQAALPAPAAH